MPYRTIELTNGLVALVDLEDYDGLSKWEWYAQPDPKSGRGYSQREFQRAKKLL